MLALATMILYNRLTLLLKCLILAMAIVFCYKELDFLQAIYEITQFQNSYYEVNVKQGVVDYRQTKIAPARWVPYTEISKNIKGAIIVSEDGKFYRHHGYDPESLRDKIYDVFVKKRKLKGGSTITQQLVKNLYLSKDKTLSRKGREFILTVFLERYASKEKIFESYLNIIEYGKDLYGIKNATQFYFKKQPKKILAREGAFLAMLLPNPIRYSRSYKNKILSRYARRQVDSILLRMKQNNYIGFNEYEMGLNSNMVFEKKNIQLEAGRENIDSFNHAWFSI